jgi:chromosome segregation ATPase
VQPEATAELAIEEEMQVARVLDVRTPGVLEQLQAFLATFPNDDALRTRIAQVAAAETKVKDAEARLSSLQREIAGYAERAGELKAQIAELRAARTGAQLQKELEKLLADIERAQTKSTADAAALKDSLTVSRVAFQNAAAGLTLGATDKRITALTP